jgi:transposase
VLAKVPLDAAYRLRVNAPCRLIDATDFEIQAVGGPLRAGLAGHAGYQAVQAVPGVGPTLVAIFVAEIGEVDRFANAAHLASWAGLTPRHRESDTVVRRGPITKQGSTLVRWAAVEAAQGARNAGWLTDVRTRIAARGAAATSPPSRWPASCSPWSTTAYATGASAPALPGGTASAGTNVLPGCSTPAPDRPPTRAPAG